MWIVKALAWIIGIVLVLITGVLLYLNFADLSWVEERIEISVTESTGRQLSIDGDFQLDVFPEPSVVVEGLTLANAEWGSQPNMVELGHFSARLDLWSLISGPIVVREIQLKDVDVLVETNEEGVSNTEIGEPTEEAPPAEKSEPSGEVPLIIELAEIRNVRITSKAPDADPAVILLEAFDINTDEATNLALAGNGQLVELPFSVEGTVGPMESLQASRNIDVDLNAGLGSLALVIGGVMGDLETLDGTDMKVEVTSDDVAGIMERLETGLPLDGSLAATLGLTGTGGVVTADTNLEIDEIVVTAQTRQEGEVVDFDVTVPALDRVGRNLEIEGLPAQDLRVEGRAILGEDATGLEGVKIALADALFRIDGSLPNDPEAVTTLELKAEGPDLQQLSPDLPPLGFAALLTAKLAEAAVDLDIANVTVGETDLAGTVSVATGERTAITARLQSTLVDLGELRGEDPEAAEDEAEEAPAEPAEGEASQEYVFTEEPLPFETLQTTDLDIDYKIATLLSHPRKALDVHTTAKLEGGVLAFRNRLQGHLGGRYASDIDLNAAQDPADMEILIKMRDLKLNLSSGEDATPEQIPTTDITLDVTSTGGSARAIASNLDGRMLITQGPGRVVNKLVGAVTGDILAQLFSAINPLSKDEEFSNWECSIFSLDITSGEADINGLLLQGEKLMIVGGGDIDFNTEQLNIEFNTKPREGVGLSASSIVSPYVKLRGTFASPSIALDKDSAILSGAAAVATGGLSILAQSALNRATAEGDQCGPTLEEVGEHPAIQD